MILYLVKRLDIVLGIVVDERFKLMSERLVNRIYMGKCK